MSRPICPIFKIRFAFQRDNYCQVLQHCIVESGGLPLLKLGLKCLYSERLGSLSIYYRRKREHCVTQV